MRNWKRATVGLIATVLAAFAIISPASAAGNTQLSGEGVFDSAGNCTGDPDSWFTMEITGDLTGCWYNHGWVVTHNTPSGAYQERGTETFVGCVTGTTICGTFSTTYTFTAKYAPDGSEIHGRCQHPLVSTLGTGGFAGATGQINFKDNVSTGVAAFKGHIKLAN